jgi:DNA-binding NarL/FixJ family response regulator
MYRTINVPPCNILLVDDHALLSVGMSELLKRMLPGCEVDFYNTIERAKAALRSKKYSYLLSDLVMPGQEVKEFLYSTRQEYPELIILILSSLTDVNLLRDYLAKGINGYLSKTISEYELKQAFEATYNGNKYISSDLNSKLAANLYSIQNTPLTKKELEVLRLVAAGYNVNKIANELYISPVTVMTHRRSILSKLGLHSAAELVKYAYDNNLT